MSILKRRIALLPPTHVTVGELDLDEPGCYRNVVTFPLEVRPKRSLYLQVSSDRPVDVAVSDAKGFCLMFKEGFQDGKLGPLEFLEKGRAALVLGVFRGDLAVVDVEAWLE